MLLIMSHIWFTVNAYLFLYSFIYCSYNFLEITLFSWVELIFFENLIFFPRNSFLLTKILNLVFITIAWTKDRIVSMKKPWNYFYTVTRNYIIGRFFLSCCIYMLLLDNDVWLILLEIRHIFPQPYTIVSSWNDVHRHDSRHSLTTTKWV